MTYKCQLNNIQQANNKPFSNKGFTLIEVLVASFILFLVITAVTMVYRGAVLSSGKAERTLIISSFVEPISENIRIEVQSSKSQNQLEGQGSMGEINFSWTAIVAVQAKAPERINASTGELDTGNKTFQLWNISLQLQLGSASRSYEFNEFSW